MFTDWEQAASVELQPNADILDTHHYGLIADRFAAHDLLVSWMNVLDQREHKKFTLC